jgi:transposase
MPCRLSREEIVTLRVLGSKGVRKTVIASTLGVCEGTVRYHLRSSTNEVDGRSNKPRKAAVVSEPIAIWIGAHDDRQRPVNVQELWEHLVEVHGYEGSYKSVLRYVRQEYGRPRMRTYRRVETPPGAQSQTDWGEYPRVDVGEGPEPLSAFIMTLSHSRILAVVWRRRKDQLSWLESHNEAFCRLSGIAAVNRIDNVKTAISRGAGAWGEINPVYRTYAKCVGFHVDACQPGAHNAKGKVEAKVRLSRLGINPGARRFDGLEHLQHWADHRVLRWAQKAICPATGQSVWESWQKELVFLGQADRLPKPFDVVVTRAVGKDCLVHFEGRQYAVPFRYAGQSVEVRGCAETVQLWAAGVLQREYPRHTQALLVIDPTCYEGQATDQVLPPPPLGRMGRRLLEIMEMPVAKRPLDLYAALAEVAR